MTTIENLNGVSAAEMKMAGRRLSRLSLRRIRLGAAAVAALSLAALAYQDDWHAGSSNQYSIAQGHGSTVHAQADVAGPAPLPSRPATVLKRISCERLPNVPGKSITTAVVEFPPNAYSPRHRHPGSVTAFVLKGSVRSQLAGGSPGTYGVGQTWFEPPGTIHLFAENASAIEPAALLSIFIADDDCGPLIIRD